MNLEIIVKELPVKRLAGVSVRTNMKNAQVDCPAIWQNFGPQLGLMTSRLGGHESYGVSVMVSEDGTFDYWAAVEVVNEAELPENVKTFELPGGLYACASVPNLQQLSQAFTYLYMEWPSQQAEYAVKMPAPCVEIYGENWQPNDPIGVWVPVFKKI